MIDLAIAPVVSEPFEHVIVPDFLPTDVYAQACETYPLCEPRSGPSGYSAFWGDPDYDELVASNPAWSAMFKTFQSQDFVDYCLTQFGDTFRRHGCLVDFAKARYVSFAESRTDKQLRHMEGPRPEPHELWVRMDILQGRVNYKRNVHLDHRRRLLSMLIYFCDGDEIAMDGGDLLLHGGDAGQATPTATTAVRPRHNLMAAFPCTPKSWHSVSLMNAAKSYRNFVQVALSSSADAWPS